MCTRESKPDLRVASIEAPGMREVSEMEADQTFDEASDRREDSEAQTKSSTNVADTGAKQANKRASNSKETEEREADPQIQLVMKLLRELHAPAQKAAKAQKLKVLKSSSPRCQPQRQQQSRKRNKKRRTK